MSRRAPLYVYVPILIWVVISLFPPFWMLLSSFKDVAEIYQMPPVWWVMPNFDAYRSALAGTDLEAYLFNSLEVAILTTALSIGLGAPAAWGLSKFRYVGGHTWFFLVIGTRMLPPVALLTPFFAVFVSLDMIDQIWALVIPYMFFNMPLAIWIMKNYFDGMPREISDAAMVDGCTNRQMFFLVALPMNIPGLALAAILVFLFSWNEFMFALVLTREAATTVPVGLTSFFADGNVIWNELSAAVMMSLVPAVVFVALFQRYIIKGIAEGALKG